MKSLFTKINGDFKFYKARQESSTNMHHHDAYEVYYLIEGKRSYSANNNIYDLESGCVTLTKPNVTHATNGYKYYRMLINFKQEFLNKYFTKKMQSALTECFKADFISSKAIKSRPLIKAIFDNISVDYTEDNLDSIAGNLAILLIELNKARLSDISSITNAAPQIIKDIILFIGKNLQEIKSISDIANKFYISKYYLSHLFKDHMGISPIEYVINLKIAKAADLLRETNHSIEYIAHYCGFSESAYFCLTFKKHMNTTPSQYRNLFKLDKK